MRGERGQSEVLGTVLLLGFTLFVVSTIVLLGGGSLSDMQDEAAFQRAESEMTQLDSRASQVALGESATQLVTMPSDRDGGMTVSDRGHVWLVTDDGTEILNESLGTITYQQHDDTAAYQGGGVWRGTGRETRMVSPPEIHYRDGTLTFPVIRVRPGAGDAPPGELRVEQGESNHDSGPGYMENTQVSMIVHSRHYAGWADYMATRADGSVTTLDHDNEVAVIDLGHLTIDGDFETGLVAQTGGIVADKGNPSIESEAKAAGTVTDKITCDAGSGSACYETGFPIDLQELDDGIEQLVNQSRSSDPDVTTTTTAGGSLDAGTYYADRIHLDGETLTVDVSQGNVTLFVDGNIGISGNGGITVVGDTSGNALKVFTLGDFALANGGAAVDTADDAGGFQLYGTSEMHFGVGQADFTGAVYAPREEPATGTNDALTMINPNSIQCGNGVDVCLGTGNPDIEGAIIAGPMEISQSADFTYDEQLTDVQPSLPADADLPPPLTFMQVSVNDIQVSGPAVHTTNESRIDIDPYVNESPT